MLGLAFVDFEAPTWRPSTFASRPRTRTAHMVIVFKSLYMVRLEVEN